MVIATDDVRKSDLTHLEARLKSELRCELMREKREVLEEIRTLRERLENFQFYVLLGVTAALPFVVMLLGGPRGN